LQRTRKKGHATWRPHIGIHRKECSRQSERAHRFGIVRASADRHDRAKGFLVEQAHAYHHVSDNGGRIELAWAFKMVPTHEDAGALAASVLD
jgi:hypothetical protein